MAVVVTVFAGAAVVVVATVVVVGAAVVVGASVVVGAAVVVGARVVGAAVVVGATVVVDATVVTGVAVSELPPHPEMPNRKVSATAYFLMVSVCHPSPEGAGATLEPLGVDTRRQRFLCDLRHTIPRSLIFQGINVGQRGLLISSPVR